MMTPLPPGVWLLVPSTQTSVPMTICCASIGTRAGPAALDDESDRRDLRALGCSLAAAAAGRLFLALMSAQVCGFFRFGSRQPRHWALTPTSGIYHHVSPLRVAAAAPKNSGPSRAPTPATTDAQYRCSERGQRVSRLTTRPEWHLVDDSDAYGHQVEIAPPNGAAARPFDRTRARARACHQAAVRRAGESAAALCHVGQSRTAHHGALIVRVGRVEAAAPQAWAGSRARGHHRKLPEASLTHSDDPLSIAPGDTSEAPTLAVL